MEILLIISCCILVVVVYVLGILTGIEVGRDIERRPIFDETDRWHGSAEEAGK